MLRFASDRDFLRLIARGDVQVFAFQAEQALLLGADQRFQPAQAPRRYYELNEATIPRLVLQAFTRERTQSAAVTWGVALPGRIETQIRDFVQQETHGVLLIDRFGEVRHVET